MSGASTEKAELPGLRRRLASIAYESLLILGVLSVSFMVPHLALGMVFGVIVPPAFVMLHIVLVLGAYFLWYWRNGGQTLAMQTWKLQLVRADNGRPTWQQLVLRYLITWVLPVFVMFAIAQLLEYTARHVPPWYPALGIAVDYLWALFDRDRQFLHDRLTGTKIIFKR